MKITSTILLVCLLLIGGRLFAAPGAVGPLNGLSEVSGEIVFSGTGNTLRETELPVSGAAALRGAGLEPVLTIHRASFVLEAGDALTIENLMLQTKVRNNAPVIRADSAVVTLGNGADLSSFDKDVCVSSAYPDAAVFATGASAAIRVAGSAKARVAVENGAKIVLTAPLTGEITVVTPVAVGAVFGVLDGISVEAAAVSLTCFVNAVDETLVAAVEGNNLVWKARPAETDIPTVPAAEAVAQVTAGGATRFYGSVAHAFAAATTAGATVRLVKDATLTQSVAVAADLTFDGNGKTLTRDGSALIAVTNVALTVKNVVLTGGTSRLIDVYQGALTLDADTTIRDIEGTGPEMVATIVVWGGTFTMNAGATIQNCDNRYARSSGDALAAGGVVVTSSDRAAVSQAFLNGGTVTGCCGASAGGIYIGNRAEVRVKGDLLVMGNTSLAGEPLNLVVHDLSGLQLVGEMTGGDASVGYTEGIQGSPDQFGVVVTAALSDAQLAASARAFVHDTNGDSGAAVKGKGQTLLVWRSALSTAGVYTDKDGTRYTVLIDDTLEHVAVPTAIAGLIYNGREQTGVVSGLAYEVTGNTGTNAGTYMATVRLRPGYAWPDGSTADKTIKWQIAKAVYDMGGVTFTDAFHSGNGPLPRTLTCKGTLPDGVTVSYTPNQLGEVGSLTVTASFTGDAVNYEPIPPMTATLTITVTIPTAVLGLVYNGSEQTGVSPWEGVCEVMEGTGTNAGSYTAVLRLSPGYLWDDRSTADKTIEWSIAKAVYDMSGVTFKDATYSVTESLPRTLVIDGTLPDGVTVSYTPNQLGEVGSLTVTASFTGDAVNYEPIPDKIATLTIYDPNPPPPPPSSEPEPVVCQPFKFTAIVEQPDGSWKLTLEPGTPYCVYTLLTSDDLANWTTVGESLVLAPGAALEFMGDGNERQRFWKVEGADGVKPAED